MWITSHSLVFRLHSSFYVVVDIPISLFYFSFIHFCVLKLFIFAKKFLLMLYALQIHEFYLLTICSYLQSECVRKFIAFNEYLTILRHGIAVYIWTRTYYLFFYFVFFQFIFFQSAHTYTHPHEVYLTIFASMQKYVYFQ